MKNAPEKDKYVGAWYLGPALFKAKLVRCSMHNNDVVCILHNDPSLQCV